MKSPRYLRVMIDSRLNFKPQVEHVSAKASLVRAAISRLMPNVGGPKHKRRILLLSVVKSVLTLEISIWADIYGAQKIRRGVALVYRLNIM